MMNGIMRGGLIWLGLWTLIAVCTPTSHGCQDQSARAAAQQEAPPDLDELMDKVVAFANEGELEKAIELMRKVRALEPRNPNLGLAMLQLLQARGAEIAATDRPAANQYFFDAAEIAATLLSSRRLPDGMRPYLASAIYNEACCYSLTGQTDKALQSLETAMSNGFDDFELIGKDPDLQPLRSNPALEELVGKYRAIVAARIAEETKQQLREFESFDFDFELPDTDGHSVAKSDFHGKVLIADFWGTWCGPCREEIPHLVELKNEFSNKGLEVLGITYEHREDQAVAVNLIEQFKREHRMNYTCVIGDEATQAQVPDFRAFPTTLFIDRAGKVRLMLVGVHGQMKLESIIKELLEE